MSRISAPAPPVPLREREPVQSNRRRSARICAAHLRDRVQIQAVSIAKNDSIKPTARTTCEELARDSLRKCFTIPGPSSILSVEGWQSDTTPGQSDRLLTPDFRLPSPQERPVYGLGIAKGLKTTFLHLFRKPVTVQFPEEVRPIPARARTNLLWFDERCTGCSTCAQACPDGCILVATSPNPDGSLNKDRYEIDFRLCMYCGLCTEACPYEAIQAGGTFKDAVYTFDDMYKDKHALIELAQDYLKTHDWTYPNGQKAPFADERATAVSKSTRGED